MLDLVRPFAFLTIRHPSRLPGAINWLAPLILALLVSAALLAPSVSINIYGPQGLLERLLSFVQTLVGFYIAALAAVSSFNSPHLDKIMPHPAPTMYIKHNGVLQLVQATRRRFLTSMFAYLAAISFLFALMAIATLTAVPAVRAAWPVEVVSVIRALGVFCFLFMIFQLALVTLWGLFYLGERMLTPD